MFENKLLEPLALGCKAALRGRLTSGTATGGAVRGSQVTGLGFSSTEGEGGSELGIGGPPGERGTLGDFELLPLPFFPEVGAPVKSMGNQLQQMEFSLKISKNLA